MSSDGISICPVCNKNFPLKSLEEHVNACLDAGSEQTCVAPTTNGFVNPFFPSASPPLWMAPNTNPSPNAPNSPPPVPFSEPNVQAPTNPFLNPNPAPPDNRFPNTQPPTNPFLNPNPVPSDNRFPNAQPPTNPFLNPNPVPNPFSPYSNYVSNFSSANPQIATSSPPIPTFQNAQPNSPQFSKLSVFNPNPQPFAPFSNSQPSFIPTVTSPNYQSPFNAQPMSQDLDLMDEEASLRLAYQLSQEQENRRKDEELERQEILRMLAEEEKQKRMVDLF